MIFCFLFVEKIDEKIIKPEENPVKIEIEVTPTDKNDANPDQNTEESVTEKNDKTEEFVTEETNVDSEIHQNKEKIVEEKNTKIETGVKPEETSAEIDDQNVNHKEEISKIDAEITKINGNFLSRNLLQNSRILSNANNKFILK